MEPSTIDIASVATESYIPSSLERKKTLLMYFFFGIVIAIAQGKLSEFELYHLKQSIGWRLLVIVYVLTSIPLSLLLLGKGWILTAPVGLILLILFVVFVYQTFQGHYKPKGNNVLVGLGGRIMLIFELHLSK